MADYSLTWSAEQLPEGVLQVAFAGQGGVGSEGNAVGARMREAIGETLTQYSPRALVIDLCGFEYRFGDWIASVALTALKAVGRGRVCVVATGETATALRSLWELNKLGQLIPIVGEPHEAVLYLTNGRRRE